MKDNADLSPDSESRVDPELFAALAAFADYNALTAETLLRFRSALREGPPADPDLGVVVEQIQIDKSVSGLLYRPGALIDATRAHSAATPAMLNIHGGGFVMGGADRDDALMRTLCNEHGLIILSVDYRLAPEAKFPIPLNDCTAAFDWLVTHADVLGLDPKRIGIRGASAGGGLAAGLALRLRDQGRSNAAWLWLLYPMLDDRTTKSPAYGDYVWTPRANLFAWTSYLDCAPGSSEVSAYAAPSRAKHLAGLPPMFLATGTIDLFAIENIEFARRVLADGGQIELHVYSGAYHGFDLITDTAVLKRYRADVRAAIARFTGKPLPPGGECEAT